MSQLNVQNMDDLNKMLGSCVLLVDAMQPLPNPFHEMLMKFGAYRVWNPVGRGQHGLSSACKSNFGPLVGTRHADEMILDLSYDDVIECDGLEILGLFYGPGVIGVLSRDTLVDSEPVLRIQTWLKTSGRRHFRAYWSEDRLDLAPSLYPDWKSGASNRLLHFEGVVNRLQLLLDPEYKMDNLPSFA
jgi:hypothetical protein